jgi:hypothetical protein
LKLNGKLICTGLLPLLLVTAGCSGIHASHSVSPASFLLPGLLKADPPAPAPDALTPVVPRGQLLAQAR